MSPLFVARSKRAITNVNEKPSSGGKDIAPKKKNFVEYDGYQFPVNLDAPWAVGKFLIQTKGKLSLKDLK